MFTCRRKSPLDLNDAPDGSDMGYSFSIERLTPTFGARVDGVDASKPVDARLRLELETCLTRYQLLLFKGQRLNSMEQVRFASVFGRLRDGIANDHYPSDHPKVHYIANVDERGRSIGRHPDPDSKYWHSDGSWSRNPPKYTMLYAVEVNTRTTKTHFADMCSVYDSLPERRKRRLADREAIHDLELSRAWRNRRWPWQFRPENSALSSLQRNLAWFSAQTTRLRSGSLVCHPLVRVHPDTGRPALFLGDHAWAVKTRFLLSGILEMRLLMRMRFPAHCIHSHEWQPNDLLVWDNRTLLHRVGGYDLANSVRVMRRCVVLDEPA